VAVEQAFSLEFPKDGVHCSGPAARVMGAGAAARAIAGAPRAARLFLALLGRLRVGQLTVHLPTGAVVRAGSHADRLSAEVWIHDWRACGAILRAGDIGFGDALRRGWVEASDLTALLRLSISNEAAIESFVWGGALARLWFRLAHALRRNSRSGSQENIHAHYDIGNAFYGLWLDCTWTYSSALFRGDTTLSLEQAQAAKYQRVIDALQLRPGMRVLEVGCGWGGFAHHAALQGIGVDGITISTEQLAHARARIAAAGLEHLARFELRDYRDIRGTYDAVVSIEMFEAVGTQYWDGWFRTLRGALAAGGRALVQSITIDENRFERYAASSDFIRHFIFPGGMLPSVRRFTAAATRNGLVTRDVFAFGRDYAQTMRRWRDRFEARLEAVRAQGFDEAFIRTWRLYLAYCEAGFEEGRTDVVQFILERPGT